MFRRAARSAARLNTALTRAWDRMSLPLPFSRAVVVVGPMLPADASAREVSAAIDDANDAACRTLLGTHIAPATQT